MSIDLPFLLPNINKTLDGTCFLFGAGASLEAGYPMMPALTQSVIGALSPSERNLLDDALHSTGHVYDDAKGSPNIEELSDLVTAHALNSGSVGHKLLEENLRKLVFDELVKVKNPDLSNHIRFLNALKKRAFGKNCCIWIITTNYDLLFEAAAAYAKVHVVNGFCGVTTRYFDASLYDHAVGTVTGGRFAYSPQLTVKLLKLHGSLSWYAQPHNRGLFETHPDAIDPLLSRIMVLPRKKKVMDTLAFPFDQIFGRASRIVGAECKYLVSCGFSFGDEHINHNILLGPLTMGRCRLTVLCGEEPAGIAGFRNLPPFNAAFNTRSITSGKDTSASTDLWKFSNFVRAFE